MSRNYAKEYEWSKTKYTRILGDIDRELAEKLKEKLKEENKSIASWITECASQYLNMKKVWAIIDLYSYEPIKCFDTSQDAIDYFRSFDYEKFLLTHNKDNFILDTIYIKK